MIATNTEEVDADARAHAFVDFGAPAIDKMIIQAELAASWFGAPPMKRSTNCTHMRRRSDCLKRTNRTTSLLVPFLYERDTRFTFQTLLDV